jgi:hypothetical protein
LGHEWKTEEDMIRAASRSNDLIARLVAKTVELGGNELDVEYKDGCESVCAMKDNIGFGIASLDSSSAEAREFRNRLYTMTKKKEIITVQGKSYALKAELYDSFGEDAFRVAIREK